MKIGCPKEVKRHEYRVGLTPASVRRYVDGGHSVAIQEGAGQAAGYRDEEYSKAGARVIGDPRKVFSFADMIVKVKEPQPEEYDSFRPGQILFTYLHLAADRALTDALRARGLRAVAYETIETDDHVLPLLKPMSQIAGRLSVQEGAKCLENPQMGSGVLLGGVPGVEKGRVGILGAGTVGVNAAKIAQGLGAETTIIDVNPGRLEYIDDLFGGGVTTLFSNEANIAKLAEESDLIIGAVLVTGARAPILIRRGHLAHMKRGSVIVDVAVDQGGCVETTHPTTHDSPTFVVDTIVHYCVANMPGAVAKTSTAALTNMTESYGLEIAGKGLEAAAASNRAIARGINLFDGSITCRAVAESFDLDYRSLDKVMC
ncbi:MAG: alanine dehydrogenase [Spirochaetia bacterium]